VPWPYPFFVHHWASDRRAIASFALALQRQYQISFNTGIFSIVKLHYCRGLDDTIGELNVRNRVGGGLHDEFPVRDSSDHSHDFIDYAREPLARPPFVSGNESSSELDDQASSFVSVDVITHVLLIDVSM